MHLQLHTPIQDKHFFNEELNELDRAFLTSAFESRVANNPTLRGRGVLRLDFLGDKYAFEGLVRGARGVWEMKTTRSQP